MAMKESKREFKAGSLNVCVYETKEILGREAAREAERLIQDVIRKRGKARLLMAAANSQLEMAENLTKIPGIDWNCVEMFHLDEYVGLALEHPASFGGFVKRNFVDKVHPAAVHYMTGDAANKLEECQRYAGLLTAAPIDVSFLGIGENGHIAFNDPHEADFFDPEVVRVVTLDERCRLQQVGEGHFPNLSSVPGEGFTITCPALLTASQIICCVPGAHKAEAVRNSLEGPISTACPASILRSHPNAKLFLDVLSASMLTMEKPC
jgi:glucosamine-6-phosphate deaminase